MKQTQRPVQPVTNKQYLDWLANASEPAREIAIGVNLLGHDPLMSDLPPALARELIDAPFGVLRTDAHGGRA